MFWKKKKINPVDKDLDKAVEKFVDSLMWDSMDSTIKDSLQLMEEADKRRTSKPINTKQSKENILQPKNNQKENQKRKPNTCLYCHSTLIWDKSLGVSICKNNNCNS